MSVTMMGYYSQPCIFHPGRDHLSNYTNVRFVTEMLDRRPAVAARQPMNTEHDQT